MASAGRRQVAGSGPKIGETGKFEGEFKVQQGAPYIQHRLDVWERLYAKHQEDMSKKPRTPIKIELPDGTQKDGRSFETTPLEIAQGISKGLADSVVVAKLVYKEAVESMRQCIAADVDEDDEPAQGQQAQESVLWDLTRPLEGSCRMELLKFDSAQGQDVFWHSSAHILGQAMERQFGCHLTIGPALESGFYYDGYFGSKKLGNDDFALIQKHAQDICKDQQAFQRCVISKDEALELFSENPFKVQLITNKVPDGALTSCYRCGPLIDLCRGPHLPSTGRAKAFKITKNSAAYWLGDQSLDTLQRLYGIAFPSEKHMKDYEKFLEEAAKRDHRNLGKQHELFYMHPFASPGSTFWLPMGARIYNTLIDFIRSEYRLRGFTEVVTPNMYCKEFFQTSGHWQNYKDDMYCLNVEKQEFFLKPMNCPGHFAMFDSRVRSYKELPMRFADFGVLHRNEASGALSGLTRVRRFQQDDAHLFVRPEQIESEVIAGLDFLKYVYGIFGFKASYALSTRPKKALGSKEIWDSAEKQLEAALNKAGIDWTLNPGDGAFYGPKIDIRLEDVMKRKHQCGTIQLDFNGPIRFNLQYRKEGSDEGAVAEDDKSEFQGAVEKDASGEVIWREGRLRHGFERPVVIHRAILGSIERMSAILIEHYGGKWPFWLSPKQVMVVPVSLKFADYAQWVKRQLMLHGFYVEVDLGSNTFNKKVREATVAHWNYLAVVGEKEMDALSVTVRQGDTQVGTLSMTDFVRRLDSESMPTSQKLRHFESFEGRSPEPAAAVAPPGTHSSAVPNGAPAAKSAAPKPEAKKGSLQVRKANSKQFAALSVDDDVEAFLDHHPYVKGYQPTAADVELFNQLSESGLPTTPNLRRWYEHIETFTSVERASWTQAGA